MTPQAKGSYFEPKHLEQVIISYLHFTENEPSQAKATLPPPIPDSCWSKIRHKSKYIGCLLCLWSVLFGQWIDKILIKLEQGQMVSTLGEQPGNGIDNLWSFEKTPFCWMDNNCTVQKAKGLGKNWPVSYVRRLLHWCKSTSGTFHNWRISCMTFTVDRCWWWSNYFNFWND